MSGLSKRLYYHVCTVAHAYRIVSSKTPFGKLENGVDPCSTPVDSSSNSILNQRKYLPNIVLKAFNFGVSQTHKMYFFNCHYQQNIENNKDTHM